MTIFQTSVVERHPSCKSTVLLTEGIFLGGDSTNKFQVFGLDWLDHSYPLYGRFLRGKFCNALEGDRIETRGLLNNLPVYDIVNMLLL
mgnify:CR=1 FL=1